MDWDHVDRERVPFNSFNYVARFFFMERGTGFCWKVCALGINCASRVSNSATLAPKDKVGGRKGP